MMNNPHPSRWFSVPCWGALALAGIVAGCASTNPVQRNGYRVVYHKTPSGNQLRPPRTSGDSAAEAASYSGGTAEEPPAEEEGPEFARAAVGAALGATALACILTKDCRSGVSALGASAPLSADAGQMWLRQLEGCFIVASDQRYLGAVTTNRFNTDSLLNEFGPHGGRFSPVSILNEFGVYGGEHSPLSPFNRFTSTPPKVVCEGRGAVAYLTRNQTLAPAVDPYMLLGYLRAND